MQYQMSDFNTGLPEAIKVKLTTKPKSYNNYTKTTSLKMYVK